MKRQPSLSVKINIWKLVSISLALLIVLSQSGVITIHPRYESNSSGETQSTGLFLSTVSAAEIYPEFTCPCCGTPLNKEEPCCGAMTDMIEYIDAKVDEGLSEEEITIATAKKFGIDRLTDESKQDEIKKVLAEQAPDDAPAIELVEDLKDLGEVSTTDGIVSIDFELKNIGESPLEINRMDSSCGCTSATLVYKDEEGPRFGMSGHGYDNPKDWTVLVSPGDTATLRVYYDPNMHPDLIGPVTRTVTVYSNDPVEFAKKVTITLEQVK